MSTATHFFQRAFRKAELAQVLFHVSVLEKYLVTSGYSVQRTNTVGRVKGSTWALDFGISPGEQTIHVTAALLAQKLPDAELAHWAAAVVDRDFSANYLKMQGSHACIDDGGFRAWGEEEPLL